MARPRKPTALKVLNGSAAHDPQRVNRDEPRPRNAPPRMPRDLGPAARLVWRRTLRDMPPGVILAAHAPVFRVYCEAVARYEAWAALLAEGGPVVRGSRGGELVRNPLVQMVRDQADQVRAFARELGLTPSSLSGVSAAPAAEADPLDELLRKASR